MLQHVNQSYFSLCSVVPFVWVFYHEGTTEHKVSRRRQGCFMQWYLHKIFWNRWQWLHSVGQPHFYLWYSWTKQPE